MTIAMGWRFSDERERAGPRPRWRHGKTEQGQPAPRNSRRRRVCKFCVEKIDYINYKDVRLLAPFLPERGKIQPRRISGTCALHQRGLQRPSSAPGKIALVPYVTD
jgi:small subunit ribosomal protein S18